MGLSSQLAPSAIAKPGVCTSSTRPASPYEGQYLYETDTNNTLVWNGSAWVCVTPQSATVNTQQTTTSSSYTDLSTSGPAVTLSTGTSALVTLSCMSYNNDGAYLCYMSVAVSGASTISASDDAAILTRYGQQTSVSRTFILTGLTAGSNTFTSKYKVSATTTGNFGYRSITVVGVP
jgi:hypothetical protein